jgi:hypothetical protein
MCSESLFFQSSIVYKCTCLKQCKLFKVKNLHVSASPPLAQVKISAPSGAQPCKTTNSKRRHQDQSTANKKNIIISFVDVKMKMKISCLQGPENHVRSLLDHFVDVEISKKKKNGNTQTNSHLSRRLLIFF